MNGIDFDIFQIVGVTNKVETSTTYIPFNYTLDKPNRTYKQNYYRTNVYGNIENANVYISIWAHSYKFLIKHSNINGIPIILKKGEVKILMRYK